MAGAYWPPFFQRLNSQKNLKCQKSEKISIPPLRSLLCTLIEKGNGKIAKSNNSTTYDVEFPLIQLE